MSSFIEELYFENIRPQSRVSEKSELYQEEYEKKINDEQQLIKTLPEEYKKLFLEYTDSCAVVNGEDTLDSFVRGFKLGAGFALDVFGIDGTFLNGLLKNSQNFITSMTGKIS